jgi:acetyltransferase-like isoleucine patch superfamily enzyme
VEPHVGFGKTCAQRYDTLQRRVRGGRAPIVRGFRAMDRAAATLWLQRLRWYERGRAPWNRARLDWELASRRAYARHPLHGNALEMLRAGRLELGEHVHLEPDVWLTSPEGRIVIGAGSFLNLSVMVAAHALVEIGEHCMLANGCLVTDADHRVEDPSLPITWQGFTSKGPTRIGDDTWLGANVVVTSGVTIGRRCVIGANSVVTSDIPDFSIAAGAPAKVIKTIEYDA